MTQTVFFISVQNLAQTTYTCDSSAGVWGAKVDNVSSEICRHPCDELMGLLTEIHGLRIVTGNLLDDLEKVVRQKYMCMYHLHVNAAKFLWIWYEQEIGY